MKSKVKSHVLITGASSGFGRELVKLFLASGSRVMATLRDSEKRGPTLFASELETYRGLLQFAELDLVRSDHREALVSRIRNEWDGRLDVLINNAGYGLFGALEDLTEEQIRHQMEVNYLGTVLLTRDTLPFLRQQKGRVISLSSVLGYSGLPLSSAYCASKFAIEGWAESLYAELTPHGIQVCLIEPGGFKTGFADHSVWGTRSHQPQSVYQHQTLTYQKQRDHWVAKQAGDPVRVAEKIFKTARSRRMPLRVRCGKDAALTALLKRLLPQSAYAFLLRKLYVFTLNRGQRLRVQKP